MILIGRSEINLKLIISLMLSGACPVTRKASFKKNVVQPENLCSGTEEGL